MTSRAVLRVGCVLTVWALTIVGIGCEPRGSEAPASAGNTPPESSTEAPAGTLPGPATRELLIEAPQATATPPAPATTQATARASSPPQSQPAETAYEYRPGSRDGIGKWYMGREIAHVVSGH